MEEESKSKKRGLKIFLIILLIIVSIFTVLTIAGCAYYKIVKNNEEDKMAEIYSKNEGLLLNFDEKIEYGTQISYDNLVEKLINKEEIDEYTQIKIYINDKEITKDESYKFENVGTYNIKTVVLREYEYKIIIKDFNKTIENSKEIEITVEDTKMPELTGVSDKEITVGDKIDLLQGIKAIDEVDGELEVKIEGDVDTNKAGEYTVKAITNDKNGNKAEKEFKVTVKEKKVTTITKNNTTTSNKNNNSTGSTSNNTSNDSSTKSGRLAIAKTEAKRVVKNIIKPGMSNYDKAYAIFNYLHSNVATQHNQSNEAYKTNFGNEAYAALILKKAACSGFCKAVTLMCNEAGLQSKHLNAGKWSHQWNTVYVNGEWIILDAQGGIFGETVHPLEY